ncbi:MAG: gamma-butyrobetaine hydroxylase-like domain-containing protein [Rhodospirillaceae bacterium]
MNQDEGVWPEALDYDPRAKILRVRFEGGVTYDLSAEYLRVESPSAEVQGHNPSQKQIVAGKQNVGIRKIEPVGNYAVRLAFDDRHDTGIYSWRYLHELGREQQERWPAYLASLAAKGLTRTGTIAGPQGPPGPDKDG